MLRDFVKPMVVTLLVCILFAIGTILNHNIENEYPDLSELTLETKETLQSNTGMGLRVENTVVYREDSTNSELFDDCYFALLIDETNKEVLCAKNAHQRIYPASMTKLMTGILVCDKIEAGEMSLDDVITVTKNYDLYAESGVPCDIKAGSRITVKDLLYELMIHSNNYYSLILGEYIAGDITNFCNLMNEKAYSIGATNTHFVNPHGLDDPNHYSSPYDMYLIMKEAHSHELLREIAGYSSYAYSYTNQEGYEVEVEVEPTNLFYSEVALPANFHIETWKTGTTGGAGYCLNMYLTYNDNSYVAIAACGKSKSGLYDAMVRLLCLVQ